MDEPRKYVVPEIVFGVGALELAGRYARNLGAAKILLVTDPGVIDAGWPQKVIRALAGEDVAHIVFADISPNPRTAPRASVSYRPTAGMCSNSRVSTGWIYLDRR